MVFQIGQSTGPFRLDLENIGVYHPLVLPLCMLNVLPEESHSCSEYSSLELYLHPRLLSYTSDSKHLLTGYFHFDIPQGPEAQHDRNSTPFLVLQTCSESHCSNSGHGTTINVVAQPRNLESLTLLCPTSSLTPVHSPHHCKNDHFTFPCTHLLSSFYSIPFFFFLNFQTTQWPPLQHKVQTSSEPCFSPDSILASVSFKFLYISIASCSWPLCSVLTFIN